MVTDYMCCDISEMIGVLVEEKWPGLIIGGVLAVAYLLYLNRSQNKNTGG